MSVVGVFGVVMLVWVAASALLVAAVCRLAALRPAPLPPDEAGAEREGAAWADGTPSQFGAAVSK